MAAFLWGLISHALSAHGSLGHHLRTMSGIEISDAAAHERRQGLSWEWFQALFAVVLKPLSNAREHPESFYKSMRLLGLDGSQWSLRNTDALGALPRKRLRTSEEKSSAAFLKWSFCVLLELGVHQPLGAACAELEGSREEGELTVARRLLACIPKDEDTLLLADRYYGRGSFLEEVQTTAGARCQWLIRVPEPHKAKVLAVLGDGSALVAVRVCHPKSQRTKAVLRLREVRGQVWRESGKKNQPPERSAVRLWTTLLDARAHPAKELLALYAQRWEQELFYRELKRHTGREQLLRAGTVQGAQAEFGAMILAASLLASRRLEAAHEVGLAPTRLSLTKISRALEALLPVLRAAGGIISAGQRHRIITRFLKQIAYEARIPPRRPRGCQRGLRKPASSWPRISTRCDLAGSWDYAVTSLTFP
jgi:hypothetical protein